MGTAREMASKILALMSQGGPFMYVLLALSVLAITIVFVKFWQFRSRRVGRRKFVPAVMQSWQSRDRVSAINQVSQERGPVAVVMLAAMQARARSNVDPETLEVEVQRVARRELSALESGLRGLELIALVAPLTGFLGTISSLMGFSGSSGPLEASLISTATGLVISIFTVFFYYILDGRVERERRAVEDAATAVIATGGSDMGQMETPTDYDEYEEYEEVEYEDDAGYYEPELR